MPIKRKVASTAISSIGYNPDRAELIVTFQHGGTYRYGGVAEAEYRAMISASSKGSYFNRWIKPSHPVV